MLTPSRKHLGKAVARRSKQKVAVECLKDSDVKRYILKAVGKIVHNEVKHLCSNTTQSILKCNSVEMLKSFSWGSLKSELSSNAPQSEGWPRPTNSGHALRLSPSLVPRPNFL